MWALLFTVRIPKNLAIEWYASFMLMDEYASFMLIDELVAVF